MLAAQADQLGVEKKEKKDAITALDSVDEKTYKVHDDRKAESRKPLNARIYYARIYYAVFPMLWAKSVPLHSLLEIPHPHCCKAVELEKRIR